MNINKKVIKELNKCYSIAPLKYNDENCFLVAAEKQDPCYLFDEEGNLIDKVWDGPGGVMSMVQVPESNGQYLSTYKFYSPNDSKEAKIVIVTPQEDGWDVRTLVDLPHVHRFDLLERDGHTYLIACTLKSGHDYKEDWTKPGKVYWAELPDDLSEFNEDNQLELKVLKDDMTRNHGYYRVYKDGIPTSVISSESGVFRITPPAEGSDQWEIEELLDIPTSDAVLVDLNGDGIEELCTLSPFHGDKIAIYDLKDGKYVKVYDYPEPAEFTHAIFGGEILGKPHFVVGHRQGKRNLIDITYDPETENYVSEIIDEDRGPANVFHFVNSKNEDVIIATNRETDEIAMYTLSE